VKNTACCIVIQAQGLFTLCVIHRRAMFLSILLNNDVVSPVVPNRTENALCGWNSRYPPTPTTHPHHPQYPRHLLLCTKFQDESDDTIIWFPRPDFSKSTCVFRKYGGPLLVPVSAHVCLKHPVILVSRPNVFRKYDGSLVVLQWFLKSRCASSKILLPL
jgi:hypothetical protein